MHVPRESLEVLPLSMRLLGVIWKCVHMRVDGLPVPAALCELARAAQVA